MQHAREAGGKRCKLNIFILKSDYIFCFILRDVLMDAIFSDKLGRIYILVLLFAT